MLRFFTIVSISLLLNTPGGEGITYEGCRSSFSLAIVIDSSVSIPDGNMVFQPLATWNSLISFTQSIITSLTSITASNISVAVIRFSTTAVVAVPLTPILPSGINLSSSRLAYVGGNTNIAEALQLANQELSKDTTPGNLKIALVLTDGLSNIDAGNTPIQAASLQNSSVEVFAIALTDYSDETSMTEIASLPTNKHLLQVSNMTQLLAMNDLIVSRICGLADPLPKPPTNCSSIPDCSICQNPEICDVCTTGHYKNGQTCSACLPHCATCIDSKTCVACDEGYYYMKTTFICKLCTYRADLAFVVDTSGSIRDKNPPDRKYDNFDIILTFITNILYHLSLGFNSTRVAEVTFSSTASVYFGFNDFYNATRDTLYDKILASPYQGSYTNTSGALRLLHTDVFTPQNGDREDAPNVAIIITDGLSNIDANLTLPEAAIDRAAGIVIYSVGVTNEINPVELFGMASSPAYVFNAPNFVSLTTTIYEALGNTLCGG